MMDVHGTWRALYRDARDVNDVRGMFVTWNEPPLKVCISGGTYPER